MAKPITRAPSAPYGTNPGLRLTQTLQPRGEMEYREKMLVIQTQTDERRPILILDSKYLKDGTTLSIVPPRDSREPRYDLVMETQDVVYRLTNGRSFLPIDTATNFFNGIATEEDFDLCREMYSEVLRKSEENRNR